MLIKRIFDILISIVGLLLLSPLLLICALLILMVLGKPVFFMQERPGLHGKPFKLIKFRTMQTVVNNRGDLLPDEQRLTCIGRVLRSTSLDELPELWNVLVGEMSIVGPRPLLMEYIPLYSDRQRRRHEALPGITGLAQVKGRNRLDWDKRLELDVWYVENHSPWLDIKILFLTLWKVFRREGINQDGHATMEKFKGEKTG